MFSYLCGMKALKPAGSSLHIPTQRTSHALLQRHNGSYPLGPVTTTKFQTFCTCFDVNWSAYDDRLGDPVDHD